jgi:hypothetical protein
VSEIWTPSLRIIVRAETRMANEIDAAQDRGEVASAGGNAGKTNVQTSDIDPAKLSDLGLDRRRVQEWRRTRDAGEPAVRISALAETTEPRGVGRSA